MYNVDLFSNVRSMKNLYVFDKEWRFTAEHEEHYPSSLYRNIDVIFSDIMYRKLKIQTLFIAGATGLG